MTANNKARIAGVFYLLTILRERSMGLLSGVAFGVLLFIDSRSRPSVDLSPGRVAGWGILASFIVQLAYLGHGDLGLAANLKTALLFSASGGLVTLVWLVMARSWLHRRSSLSSS